MSGLRQSRILCLLLSFLLLCPVFSINVSAAEETNLIESDLREWESLEGTGVSITEYNGSYLIGSSSDYVTDDTYLKTTVLYDLSQLVAGNSYTFSFEILDLFDAQSLNSGLNWDNYYGGPSSRSGVYTFGLGSFDYSSNTVDLVDNFYIEINSSNYSSMYGTSHTLTFDMPNVVNPCIVIYYLEVSNNYENQYIMLRNLSLVDNTKANTDSILDRIFIWFEVKFKAIGDSFTDLGDRIKGFFSDLSTNISDGLSDVRDGITTKFAEFEGWLSSLGDRISVFFNTLAFIIGNDLLDVRDKINEKIGEVSEKFTNFFDKFKPRVHLNLDWSRGTFNVNGEVIQENNSNVPVIIVSELFEVPSGSSYYVSYNKFDSSLLPGAGIVQYDLSGKFLGVLYSTNASFEEYELPSGYMYRFRQSWTKGIEVDDDIANQHFSLYCDAGWLNALLFNFKSMIKGLFVPDEAFISQWKSDMELTLSEHLGFIYQIPALTIDYVERLQGLFSDKTIYFSIPSCEFELNGEFINLWPETSLDFSFLTNAEEGNIWHTIYKQIYPVFLRLVLFGILINYGRNEWNKVMMN